MSIVIMVDSGANVTKAILKKYSLSLLPYNVTFKNGDTYKDVFDIKNLGELIKMIDEYQEIPEIDQVGDEQIEKCFSNIIENGNDILYIGVSSKLSEAFNRVAKVAKKFNENTIQVVDSLNVGIGETLLALYAREYVDRGYGLKQTAKYINDLKQYIKSCYTINKPSYLYRQNRCREVTKDFIRFYRKIPVAEIDNGEIVVTFVGKDMEVAHQILRNLIMDNSKNIDSRHVLISYSTNREDAVKLKHSSNKLNKEFNIELIENSSSVFINAGDKCLCVAFLVNKKSYR